MEKKYDVFISCKSEDYGYAEEVYNFLNSNGIQTFLASKELRKMGDSEYRKAIMQALESAYHLIIFASNPGYIESKWVFYEWDTFVNAKLNGRKDGQIMTILKGFNTDKLRLDLIKYESFTFEKYKERLLFYVETPESRRVKEEQKRQEELFRRQAAIEARKQIEEEKRARIREEEYQKALAETRRNETEERICEESKARVHDSEIDLEWLSSKRNHIIEILRNLGIFITHIQATVGVSTTLFEVTLTPTMQVVKVRNLSNDIVRLLNENKARVLAPMPNKNTIGIEIPNKFMRM